MPRPSIVTQVGLWWLTLTGLWWLLSGASGWGVGALLALAGALLAAGLGVPPMWLRWRAIPAFVLFFFRELLAGALDVSRKALLPGRRVAPRWMVYRMQAKSEGVRLVMSLTVGLLPGTLASHIDGDDLHVHVLDTTQHWRSTVGRLEQHLMRVGGSSL